MTQTEEIYVFECFRGGDPVKMGLLHAGKARGRETCAFEFDPGWLERYEEMPFLDPGLESCGGRQYPPTGRMLFGSLADSCPDRWGRRLLKRQEGILAERENRNPRQLTETDFLTGVCDETRMGALRFSLREEGPFLSSDVNAAPSLNALKEMESASLACERDDGTVNERILLRLIAPGAALGGARPKVSVRALDGSLWIAKMPSMKDRYDVGAWEQVTHDLAAACGLNVPVTRLERFSSAGAVFLTKRFDRAGSKRVHFCSALSLLGKRDGASADDGSSYPELAEFIAAHGVSPEEDLRELWKRIVFGMAVSNADDHLRNHGFLLTSGGWRLSPMYDVNPVPGSEKLALNVTLNDARIDLDLALETAPFFRIKDEEAERTARKMLTEIGRLWRPTAEKYGMDRHAQNLMAPAFALCRDHESH